MNIEDNHPRHGDDRSSTPDDLVGVERMLDALGDADRHAMPSGLVDRMASATMPEARRLRIADGPRWLMPLAAAAAIALVCTPAVWVLSSRGPAADGRTVAAMSVDDMESDFALLAEDADLLAWDFVSVSTVSDAVDSLDEAMGDPWSSLDALDDVVFGSAVEGAI